MGSEMCIRDSTTPTSIPTPPEGQDPADLGGLFGIPPEDSEAPGLGGMPESEAPDDAADSSDTAGGLASPGTDAGHTATTGTGQPATASGEGVTSSHPRPRWDSEVVVENEHGGETRFLGGPTGTQTEVYDADGNLIHVEFESSLDPGESEFVAGDDEYHPTLEGTDTDGSGTIDRDELWKREGGDPTTRTRAFPDAVPKTPSPATAATGAPSTNANIPAAAADQPLDVAASTDNVAASTDNDATSTEGDEQPQSDHAAFEPEDGPDEPPLPDVPSTIGGNEWSTEVDGNRDRWMKRGGSYSEITADGRFDPQELGFDTKDLGPLQSGDPGFLDSDGLLDVNDPDLPGKLSDLEEAQRHAENANNHEDIVADRDAKVAELTKNVVVDRSTSPFTVTLDNETYEVITEGEKAADTLIEFEAPDGSVREIPVGRAARILAWDSLPFPDS